MTDLLFASEVARLYGVTRKTVNKWARDGRLPAIRPGKDWRFNRHVVEKLLADTHREA